MSLVTRIVEVYAQRIKPLIIGLDTRVASLENRVNTGEVCLPPSTLRDEKDATYFYYGWESVNGGWLIQRQLRSQGTSESATTGHADLSAAWPNRATLGYS